MNTIPTTPGGDDAISLQSIHEKVKIMGGTTISVKLDLANVTTLIPGDLLKHTAAGYVPLGITDVVGDGDGMISPAKVVISYDFYNKALGYMENITGVMLTSKFEAWMAWNHAEASVAFGNTVYIANGVFTATATPADLTEGTYLVGYITEDQDGSEEDDVWKFSTESGTRTIPASS